MMMTDKEFERRQNEIDSQWRASTITNDDHTAQMRALKAERGIIVYVAMNEDGDYEVGTTANEAEERLDDNHGGWRRETFRARFIREFPAIQDGPTVVVPAHAVTVTEMTDAE